MGVIKRTWRRKAVTPLRRKARTQARRPSVKCGTCGKRYTNPLAHTCAPKSDFRGRKRDAERQRKREAARKRRKAAADRRRAAAAARRAKAKAKRSGPRRAPGRQAHDYHVCRDGDCTRTACKAYVEGIADCPRDHSAEGG
jgi:hypothetical protein